MHKFLMATSALLLFSAGAGLAQDRVEPGTGQFEPSDLGDNPQPDFVDPNAPEAAADNGILPGILPGNQVVAQADCFRVEPGTGEFEPSDQNDDPTPGFVETECPENAVGGTITGGIGDGDRIDPGTGQFEPSDQGDDPMPDFVEPVEQ